MRSSRRTSSADNPATRTTLFRVLAPDAILTEPRGTFKRFAKNSIQASFAFPSTGGAVSATLIASPTSLVIAFFFARGWSLTANVTLLGESRVESKKSPMPERHKQHETDNNR
jgi:hypothetical protein